MRRALVLLPAILIAGSQSYCMAAGGQAEEPREKARPAAKPAIRPAPAAAAAEAPSASQAAEDLATGKLLSSDAHRSYREAIRLLERALARDPSLSEAHLYLGNAYARIGELEKGTLHYETFLHEAPEHPKARAVEQILRDYFARSRATPRWPLPERD